MGSSFNVYCDESSHLENDGVNDMALGAVWCPKDRIREINDKIIAIKERNGVSSQSEIKWTKIGPVKLRLYSEILDYFFIEDDLHFRGLVIPDKKLLRHKEYNQTHDEWYYKMYFEMVKNIIDLKNNYNFYIDIKDSHSFVRSQKLQEVCCNNFHDFSSDVIRKIQPIKSDEVQIMQLVDILTGAITYKNRKFPESFLRSATKLALIDKIEKQSGCDLTQTTSMREEKVNILIWKASSKVVSHD